MARVVPSEHSSKKSWPFLGAFLGGPSQEKLFLEQVGTSLSMLPIGWALLVQLEDTVRPALTAHVITAKERQTIWLP